MAKSRAARVGRRALNNPSIHCPPHRQWPGFRNHGDVVTFASKARCIQRLGKQCRRARRHHDHTAKLTGLQCRQHRRRSPINGFHFIDRARIDVDIEASSATMSKLIWAAEARAAGLTSQRSSRISGTSPPTPMTSDCSGEARLRRPGGAVALPTQ